MMSNYNIDITFRPAYFMKMARAAFTLRIDAEERTALEHLSKLEGRPINQLLNEAIKSFLNQQSPKEVSLEANLAALQEYRKRDPGFQGAIAAFVNAEARLEDPLEGKPVEGQFVEGKFQTTGPVQSKIHELLDA